ncbi:MCP four helix bundle domain-containing protein [Pseudoalteromonas piscicida]|uniref:MCP four helix bundle domain-containing protein n=1 Tax=Pseudoalteromonas piscicida TaxID=43662 RepID=UPI0030C930C3
MSVKYRLMLLSLFPIFVFIVLAFTTASALTNLGSIINNMYKDRIVPLERVKEISDNFAVAIVDTFHKLRAKNISEPEALRLIDTAKKSG